MLIAKLVPKLSSFLNDDPNFVRDLDGLAKVYAQLNPTTPIAQEPLHFFLDTLLKAQDEATLRQGADELRSFVQSFESPEDALRFGSRLVKVAKHTPDLPQKHDAAFLWELMQLGGAYATLDPLHLATSEEEPLKFFLDTLWRARDYGAIQQGIGEFATFLNGVDEPTKLLKLEQRLIEAAKQAPTLDASLNDVKFLSALIGLARPYAALNPSPIANADETAPIAFLNTFWWAENQAEVETGIEQFAAFVQNIDDSTHLLQFEQNLLTAVQHSSAADLQIQAQHGQFLSNLMDLSRSYAAFFPEIAPSAETQPRNSFLSTLWHAEEATALEQGQAELETFIQGVDDPDRLLSFESHLLQAAKLPLMSLGEGESFLAALVRLGKDYATLNPAPPADLDIAPPELFLDRLWQAQPEAAQAAIEFSSQQLTEFLSPFTLPQRSQVLEFECNLLEWVKQIPALQPQLQDAQFVQDLLGVGQLYAALRFSDPSPSEALPRPSFLDQLWQGEPLQGETLEQAQSLFEGLGVAVGNPKAVLLALRLAIAQERQPEVPADPEADPDAVPAPMPDLTLQMGQLAAAYGALNPEPSGGTLNFFLDTLWSTGNSAEPGNLEKIEQGAIELQAFLKGSSSGDARFSPQEQSRVLESATKMLKVATVGETLSPEEKKNPQVLQELLQLSRTYAQLRLGELGTIAPAPEGLPNLFLETLWQASVDDETAIAQASEEFSSFLNGFAALVNVPDRLQFIGKVPQLQYITKLLIVFRIAWERADDRLQESLQELWHNIVPIAGVTVAIGGLALVIPQFVVPVLEILNVIGTAVAGYEAYQSFSEFLTLLNHAQDEDDLSQAADELLNTAGNLAFFTLGAIGFVKSLPYLRTLLTTVLQKLKSFPEALMAEALLQLRPLLSSLGETLRPVLESAANLARSGQVLVKLITQLDVLSLLRSLPSNGALRTIFTMEQGTEAIDALSHLMTLLKESDGLQGLKTFLEGIDDIGLVRLIAIDQRLQVAENATVMELLQPNAPLIQTILEAENGVGVVDALGYLTGLVGKNEKLLESLNGANADTLNALVQVAEGLKQNSSVRQALSQCPDLIGVILKSGVEAIEPLAQLLTRGGMTPQLLMNLLDQEGMSIETLQEFLSQISVSDLKEFINTMSVVNLQELLSKDLSVADIQDLLDIAGAGGNWTIINPVYNPDDPSVVLQLSPNMCGSACGQMLLHDLGIVADQRENILPIARETLPDWIGARERIEPSGLASALNRLDMSGTGTWRGGPIALPEAAEGIMNILNNPDRIANKGSWVAELRDADNHLVVVDGLDEFGNIKIRDPWDATRYTMTPEVFRNHWTGRAVFKQ